LLDGRSFEEHRRARRWAEFAEDGDVRDMKVSIWCATVAALGLLGGSGPGLAATTRGMARLDLRLRPGDVVLPPEAPLIEPAVPAPSAQSVPEVVGEVDRLTEPETPNRQVAGRGPLGELVGEDGLLKELLENKTIPLFRVRVEPPF